MAVVAIDVGGTFVRATAADAAGIVVSRASQSADRIRSEDPIGVFAGLIDDIRQATSEPLDGVVIGLPGILDRSRRSVVNTPNLKSLNGLALADQLEDICGLSVFLDHDVTLQTRGEALRGSAAGFDQVLGIYFGTGVGAAFLDRGKLFGGIYRTQIGHVPLRGEGRVGTGGAIDCVEAYASGLVLGALASKHRIVVEDIFRARSTQSLQRDLEAFVSDQALTIATAVTLTGPRNRCCRRRPSGDGRISFRLARASGFRPVVAGDRPTADQDRAGQSRTDGSSLGRQKHNKQYCQR